MFCQDLTDTATNELDDPGLTNAVTMAMVSSSLKWRLNASSYTLISLSFHKDYNGHKALN